MIITLLTYSTTSSANNIKHEYDGRPFVEDSVLLSYEDIRTANSKLIELNYEKEINYKLRTIIENDRKTLADINAKNSALNERNKQIKKQRNIAVGTTILFVFTTLLLIK